MYSTVNLKKVRRCLFSLDLALVPLCPCLFRLCLAQQQGGVVTINIPHGGCFIKSTSPTPYLFLLGQLKLNLTLLLDQLRMALEDECWWQLIIIDIYTFFAFSDLTCHLKMQVQVFSGCTIPPDSKETELGSSD